MNCVYVLIYSFTYPKYYIFEPRHDKTNKMGVRPAETQISLGIPREVLKTEGEAWGFQHLPRDLVNVNEWQNHIWSLLLHEY